MKTLGATNLVVLDPHCAFPPGHGPSEVSGVADRDLSKTKKRQWVRLGAFGVARLVLLGVLDSACPVWSGALDFSRLVRSGALDVVRLVWSEVLDSARPVRSEALAFVRLVQPGTFGAVRFVHRVASAEARRVLPVLR